MTYQLSCFSDIFFQSYSPEALTLLFLFAPCVNKSIIFCSGLAFFKSEVTSALSGEMSAHKCLSNSNRVCYWVLVSVRVCVKTVFLHIYIYCSIMHTCICIYIYALGYMLCTGG